MALDDFQDEARDAPPSDAHAGSVTAAVGRYAQQAARQAGFPGEEQLSSDCSRVQPVAAVAEDVPLRAD